MLCPESELAVCCVLLHVGMCRSLPSLLWTADGCLGSCQWGPLQAVLDRSILGHVFCARTCVFLLDKGDSSGSEGMAVFTFSGSCRAVFQSAFMKRFSHQQRMGEYGLLRIVADRWVSVFLMLATLAIVSWNHSAVLICISLVNI